MVKRYYPQHTDGPGAEMFLNTDGEWVDFDDYQELQDDMSVLQIKYDNLVKALGEIYREA